MKCLLSILLVFAFCTYTNAADYCTETVETLNISFGIEAQLTKRICGPKASVKAKHEYRFRFPHKNPYSMRVMVDKEKSRIPFGKLGLSKATVRKSGKWSTMIYIDSPKKNEMPGYSLKFKYSVPKDRCGDNMPAGYEILEEGGKCIYQQVDCAKVCGPKASPWWTEKGCDCLEYKKNNSGGVKG